MIVLRFGGVARPCALRHLAADRGDAQRSRARRPRRQALHLPWAPRAARGGRPRPRAAARAPARRHLHAGLHHRRPPARSPNSRTSSRDGRRPARPGRTEVAAATAGARAARARAVRDRPAEAVAASPASSRLLGARARAVLAADPRAARRATSSTARASSPTAAPGPAVRRHRSDVAWADGALRIPSAPRRRSTSASAGCCSCRACSCGRGSSRDDPAWSRLVYPARGIGTLWDPGRGRPRALAALLGAPGRPCCGVDRPCTTTDLARRARRHGRRRLPHLRVLREAGLVLGHRVGRTVLYRRSPGRGDHARRGEPLRMEAPDVVRRKARAAGAAGGPTPCRTSWPILSGAGRSRWGRPSTTRPRPRGSRR